MSLKQISVIIKAILCKLNTKVVFIKSRTYIDLLFNNIINCLNKFILKKKTRFIN